MVDVLFIVQSLHSDLDSALLRPAATSFYLHLDLGAFLTFPHARLARAGNQLLHRQMLPRHVTA